MATDSSSSEAEVSKGIMDTDSSSSEAEVSKGKNKRRLKSKIEKVPKELKQFLMEWAEKSRDLKLKMGGSCQTSSPPPKHATQKEEYVKPSGTGHEATGAGDSGGGGKKDKDDHGSGGRGSGGRGGGGGGQDKKKKGFVYCAVCGNLISSEGYEDHLRETHHIFA